MNANADLHHQYAADRLERLRTDATALRLAELTPLRTRITRLARLITNRVSPAAQIAVRQTRATLR